MASVGDRLRLAREARGLGVSEIVEQTKMKTDQVHALENGEWSVFAAPVYTRGFVRNYATLLRMDANSLLQDLEVEMGQSQAGSSKVDGEVPLRSGIIDWVMLHFSSVNWRTVLPILILVGIATGGYYAWDSFQRYNSTDHLRGLGTSLDDELLGSVEDQLPIDTAQSPTHSE
tara:strand:+ start:68 stop:586 length:519 start_codon:yes stop_codon:yes gene_type:complete